MTDKSPDLVPYQLDLEPTNIMKLGWIQDTPGAAIAAEYMLHLKETLADAVVEPDFDPAQVKSTMVRTVEEHTPGVVWDVINHESYSRNEDYQPLIRTLSELVTSGELDGAGPIAPSQEYATDIARQVEALPENQFARLKQFHDAFTVNRSLELATETTHLYQERKPGWLDDAFELVGQAVQSPDYTPDINSPEALYLIQFMPNVTRQLTRRVYVGNHMTARVEASLGDMDDTELEVLEAIKAYTATGALEGQQWRDAGKWFGMAKSTGAEIAVQSAKGIEALAEVQDHLEQGRGMRVARAWNDVAKDLQQDISDASSFPNPLCKWELIDSGHCFGDHWNDTLRRVTDADTYIANGSTFLMRNYTPAKTGEKVVILEDDERQMAQWRQTFDAHSVYQVADGTSHATLEGLDSHYTDPEATMFLLDVQNGEDLTAGIRAADELVRTRLAMIKESSDPSTLKRTEIIVWTASPEAEEAADAHLRRVLESEGITMHGSNEYVDYYGGGWGTSSPTRRLKINVRGKYISPHDLGVRPDQSDG